MITTNETFQEFARNCTYIIAESCKECIQSKCKRIVSKKDINVRLIEFNDKVFSHTEYSTKLLEDFSDYWTETSENSNKMRFEKEKTWDLSRRLKRWKRNDFNNYDKNNSNDSDRINKIKENMVQQGKLNLQ